MTFLPIFTLVELVETKSLWPSFFYGDICSIHTNALLLQIYNSILTRDLYLVLFF